MPLSCIPIGNPNEIQKITLSVNSYDLHHIGCSNGSEFLLTRSRVKLKHEWSKNSFFFIMKGTTLIVYIHNAYKIMLHTYMQVTHRFNPSFQ